LVGVFGRPSINEGGTAAFGGNIAGDPASSGVFVAGKKNSSAVGPATTGTTTVLQMLSPERGGSRMKRSVVASGLAVAVVLGGLCLPALGQAPQKRDIILATTTSTQDSGLLDTLVPLFEKRTGYRVKTIAVGSGQSLAMGARGDADLVLAHAPGLERKYVGEGAFVNRRMVMHNDFIIVGPAADPARVRPAKRVRDAFVRIAEGKAPFVSRGDKSGTHLLETELWEKVNVKPQGSWYIQAGQGMGAVLNIASEKGAYTLTDRGTYLALKKRLNLDILFEKDRPLLNIYHVMEVNPAKHSKVNAPGAKAFADFLLSAEAQGIIKTFGVEKFGQPLFFPDGGKTEKDFEG
jgi:tungstate transport system substrate-binding protein